MKSNRSVSTYSARVISSDEDTDSVFPKHLPSRIKSVVLDCRSKRSDDRKRRKHSPSSSARARESEGMEMSADSSIQPVHVAQHSELLQIPSTSSVPSVMQMAKTEPDVLEPPVFTLDSSVREVSQEEYEENKPTVDTVSNIFPASYVPIDGDGSRGLIVSLFFVNLLFFRFFRVGWEEIETLWANTVKFIS